MTDKKNESGQAETEDLDDVAPAEGAAGKAEDLDDPAPEDGEASGFKAATRRPAPLTG